MRGATLRQLRIFSEVSRYMSFVRAAEAMHLTAPAVSQQIKSLEEHAGVKLFVRDGKSISFTTAGEYLLFHVRKIMAQVKDAEDMLLRLQHVEVGRLVIGMVSTAEYFVPALMSQFGQEFSGIEIKLVLGNRAHLAKLLEDNEVDIAIMGRAPKELKTRAEPFAAHPHVFIAAPEHPLCSEHGCSIEQICQAGVIMREPGSGTRAAMMELFDQHGIMPRKLMETYSNETIKQAVIAKMGLGFVSLHTIEMELSNHLLEILPVSGAPVVRTWHVVTNLNKFLSPAAEKFRYFVLEHAEKFLAERFGHLQMH